MIGNQDDSSWRFYREFFRALGNPTRFSILHLLRQGPRHVGEIAEQLGFEQSRVSHNLACLLHCGFLQWAWEGKNKVYRLNAEIVPILAGVEKHLAGYTSALESCGTLAKERAPFAILAKSGQSRRSDRRGSRHLQRIST